jgi:very-short-patch-repair endonuclease
MKNEGLDKDVITNEIKKPLKNETWIIIGGKKKWLNECNQCKSVRYNYRVDNKFYDFYMKEKSLLIEVDGVYWHGRRKVGKKLNSMQKGNIKNDRYKNKLAIERGFKLIRFWEGEISEKSVLKKLEYI